MAEEYFAKYDINFLLNDPRVWKMTAVEFRIYVTLWAYSVATRSDLHQFCSRKVDIGRICGVKGRYVDPTLTLLRSLDMIKWDGENTIYVCGVRDKHKKLKWKERGQNKFDFPKNREEKNREEKTETEVSSDIPFDEIIQDLNNLLNKNLQLSKIAKKHISGRWSEGYRLNDFKVVHRKKALRWGRDDKMKIYLGPKTLYAPSYFDEYLNESIDDNVAWSKGSDGEHIYNEGQRKVIKNILAELKELAR
jgi:uncharacterized phage protein (TIGR02220 family)